MENKYVGLLIIGITILFLFIVFSFNQALETIVSNTCNHGIECPMQTTLKTQKAISYSLIGLLILVGGFFTFLKEKKAQPIEVNAENLDEEEKKAIGIIKENQGSIYQSDLMKALDYSKVKVTRLLDKLEGRGIIERKRRGMTNIVVIK